LEYGPLGSISHPIKINLLDYFRYLHQSRFIEDPVNKTKSVIFTEEGLRESERLFNQYFVIPERTGN
jgi:hypothetical protein